MMLLTLLLSLLAPSASAGCDLLERYPHDRVATLSDGTKVSLPSQSRKFVSYVLMGTLDPAGAADRLSSGLVPLEIDGHAFGSLSVFDYQDSDFGVFRESYFVIIAGKTRLPARPALDHLKAWSTSETAALASRELWGIPSTPAEIDVNTVDSKTTFQIRAHDIPVIDMTWTATQALPNPFAHFIDVDAVGPGDGSPVTSPILGCGMSTLAEYGAGDSLVVHDRSLDVLLKALAFRPMAKALFSNEQAVQFAPTR